MNKVWAVGGCIRLFTLNNVNVTTMPAPMHDDGAAITGHRTLALAVTQVPSTHWLAYVVPVVITSVFARPNVVVAGNSNSNQSFTNAAVVNVKDTTCLPEEPADDVSGVLTVTAPRAPPVPVAAFPYDE